MAAGGPLSSMFWNPATMTQYDGKAFEANVTGIFPKANQSYSTSSLVNNISPLVFGNGVSNSGEPAAVPSSFSSYQINDRLWLGMAITAPFGLSVAFPGNWAGSMYGEGASVKSLNFSPSVAYKINEQLSVAVGFQAQWMSVNHSQFVPVNIPGANMVNIGGDGWGYGFTAGVTYTPMPGTQLGIGYRSAINQKISGSIVATTPLAAAAAGITPGSVGTTLNLPDQLSVGLRQRIADRWTLLAGFEFANWARIGTANVTGSSTVNLPFQYSNGYFYSLGFEYQALSNLTLRTGIAYEKSPITDLVRTPGLPDNDRMWYSVGATYKAPFKGLSFDVGYSYIDVKNTPVNLGPGTGNPWTSTTAAVATYVGSVQSNIQIVSLAARYQWDAVK